VKIIELRAENIKRLTAVNIRPDGNVVEITGKNGQGKTSVLDAIWWALEGKENIQAAPIRRGATEAHIKLDLGQLKVTRTFKAVDGGHYTTTITVENDEGARFPSPQKVLDSLLGELSFDPLAFTRMKPADQFETLKRFVPGIDFAAIAAANKTDYDKRTDANRRAKELRAQAAGLALPQEQIPGRIDEAKLVADLEAAGEHNADIERRRARRQQAQADIDRQTEIAAAYRANAAELRRKADAEDAKAAEHEASVAGLKVKLEEAPALPDPIDTTALRDSISQARTVNERIDRAQRARQERERLTREATEFEAQSAALTAAIKKRDDDKTAAIATAQMPIEGVGFGDGHVLMRGVPFDQASDAEQLRASIAIAAAMNPKLRVIRVRDGSLLDDDAMVLLAEFANAHDLQIWIERVDSSGRVGFVLEDGHLKSDAAADAKIPEAVS
jgi:energy-coupling factor transporter ATP-binding protein EcfA2